MTKRSENKKLFENDELNINELISTLWDFKWVISTLTLVSAIFIVFYSLSIYEYQNLFHNNCHGLNS